MKNYNELALNYVFPLQFKNRTEKSDSTIIYGLTFKIERIWMNHEPVESELYYFIYLLNSVEVPSQIFIISFQYRSRRRFFSRDNVDFGSPSTWRSSFLPGKKLESFVILSIMVFFKDDQAF